MKTEVKLQRGTRETVYEVDLPLIPEGHILSVPDLEWCTAVRCYVDIRRASGPLQVVIVR